LFGDEMLVAKYRSGGYGGWWVMRTYWRRVRQLMGRHRFDLLWIEKEALPWLPVWLERALLRGVPFVLDYDDALFHNYDLHPSRWVRRFLGARIDRLMTGARLVVGGNDYLAQRARDAGAPWVEVVPTVIDLEHYVVKAYVGGQEGVLRVVWIGSPSTVGYLAALEAPLAALARRIAFKLRVIGGRLEMLGVDVECVQWTEDSEVASIAECDVGIMPLTDSPWERGKCGYKLIQYMACGLPVVASPVGVNTQIVQDGVNGFLAEEGSGWEAKLGQLLGDTVLREAMGRAGRRRVENEYCMQQVAPRLAGLLLKAGRQQACAD
jgi:glycosyltransferase involved in cell wall biosynthesis